MVLGQEKRDAASGFVSAWALSLTSNPPAILQGCSVMEGGVEGAPEDVTAWEVRRTKVTPLSYEPRRVTCKANPPAHASKVKVRSHDSCRSAEMALSRKESQIMSKR